MYQPVPLTRKRKKEEAKSEKRAVVRTGGARRRHGTTSHWNAVPRVRVALFFMSSGSCTEGENARDAEPSLDESNSARTWVGYQIATYHDGRFLAEAHPMSRAF
ncbi:unnamed protein product [Caenorhabditis auriculariae]|uniref:Uncharacterized protein n=1 Tax=Caenorhabditis auriculariae TaxID=2777116 RepID=A0A8S1HUP8_9PELO|nr:unnamed protein product [Caenorhabditis auriculariae]